MSFLETLPIDLQRKIVNVIKQNPESIDAFNSLYFHLIQTENAVSKRRKVAENNHSDEVIIDKDSIILLLPKLSFQSPLRKKLNLTFVLNKATQKPILVVNKDDDLSPELVLSELTNSNISFAAFLPVIEKPKLQHLVVFYKKNAGDKFNNDPLILNFNEESLIQELVAQKALSPADKNYKNRIIRQASICGFKIDDPFAGGVGSFFVEAHKGTKEGVLYFLPNNILFGFKKPILFYDSKNIRSITYSSITRVTFNITLLVKKETSSGGEPVEEKIEFSMIDQSEFSKIDAYIKSKEVTDNSMAEELKAKPLMKHKTSENGNEGVLSQITGDDDGVGQEEDDSDDEEADGTYQIGDEIDESGSEDSSDEDYDSNAPNSGSDNDSEDDQDED